MRLLLLLATAVAAVAALTGAWTAGAASQPRVAFTAASYGRIVLLDGMGNAVKSFGPGQSPAFSTDGSTIAFVRDGDLLTVRVDGTWLTRLTRTVAREESPDWGPDGSLVYASNRTGNWALYVRDATRRVRRLTRPSRSWQEDRSPASSSSRTKTGTWSCTTST